MNAPTRALLVLLSLSSAMLACAGSHAVFAKNPLDGGDRVLTATRAPKSDTFKLAKQLWIDSAKCDAAVEDAVSVAISQAEVCIETARAEAVPATSDASSASPSSSDPITLSGYESRSLSLPAVGAPTKVATCQRSDGATMDVVRIVHRGCTDTAGLIDSSSPRLVFDEGAPDEVRWEFEAHERTSRI